MSGSDPDDAQTRGWGVASAAAAGALAGAVVGYVDLTLVASSPVAGQDGLAETLLLAVLGGTVVGLLSLAAAVVPGLRRVRSGTAAFALSAALTAAGCALIAGDVIGRDASPEALSPVTRWTLIGAAMAAMVAGSAMWAWTRPWRSLTHARAAGALAALALVCAGAGAFADVGLPWVAVVIGGGIVAGLGQRFPRFFCSAAAVIGFAGLVIVWPHPAPPPPPASPLPAPAGSSVLIVLDTLRADVLGAYGSQDGLSPTFDRLAGEGALYTNMISPSGWTLPSHISMFTGEFPRVHGVGQHDRRRIDDSQLTFIEELRERGFDTAALSANPWPRVSGLTRRFDESHSINFLPRDELVLARWMRASGIGWTLWIDQGAGEAIEEVGGFFARRDRGNPFFVFVNLYEAHDPYVPPLAYRTGGPTEWLRQVLETRRFDPEAWNRAAPRPDQLTRVFRSRYEGEVVYQDRMLDKLVGEIGKWVALDDITIMVTADHGENFGEGQRWGHIIDVNDILTRVPFVVRSPRHVAAGSVVDDQQQLMDVHATLRRVAGIESEAGVGHDLFGASAPWPVAFADFVPNGPKVKEMRAERADDHPEGVDWPVHMARADGWKYVRFGSGRERLYHSEVDPFELENRLHTSPAIANRLRAELDGWMAATPERTGDDPRRESGSQLNPAERARMRALGYIE